MVIELIAISKDKDRAFARIGSDIWLVSPFIQGCLLISDEEHAGYLLANRLYIPCDKTFKLLTEAVKYLSDSYIEMNNTAGISKPTSAELRELIKYIDIDNILKYLDRMENELIPNKEIKTAKEIAIVLFDLDLVQQNPEICDRVTKIIEM